MKKKIQVKEIIDKNTKIPVNCAEHRINEIKAEIKECLTCPRQIVCKTEVLEMWKGS